MQQQVTGIETLIGYEELVQLCLVELDREHPLNGRVEEAVRELLTDPGCPLAVLRHADIDFLDTLVDMLRGRGDHVFAEAITVSLHRIRQETGWIPGSQPLAAALLADVGETYLLARHAFGVIALAWQVQTHQTDIWFTAGATLRAVN